MKQEEKENIIKALNERNAKSSCSRCGGKNFSLLDGYFNPFIQSELNNNILIGGPSIPTIGVICNRCGNINYHAIGALGLTKEKTEDAEIKNEQE